MKASTEPNQQPGQSPVVEITDTPTLAKVGSSDGYSSEPKQTTGTESGV